jgi:hypothetical protein
VFALALAGAGRPATGSPDPQTISFAGRPVFPIVLSPGPPLGSQTPWGTDALKETASAGVNVFRVGPGGPWTSSDVTSALAMDQAAADLGVHTWVNLSGYSQATPGSTLDAGLAHVVGALTSDPSHSAIGMWRGRDEPWWSDITPTALEFAYCRVTSLGDPAWCGGEPALYPGPPWVTIEAPRGSVGELAPYSDVTDVHGVDIYPVTLAAPEPDLHRVGAWTAALASITLEKPVWTTLQICAGASYGRTVGGPFVLPTLQQERYMAYDAIINGAGALAFYGGNLPGCWNASDEQYGWSWTFWENVLKPLVEELSASSPIAPALVDLATSRPVRTSDRSTEAVLREGTSVDDLWLLAARAGPGARSVQFSGLPSWTHAGGVYREQRRIVARAGSFSDRFNQWDVHVYHFVEPLKLRTATPARATVGSRVTLQGRGLAAATTVSFGGAHAHFTISSDRKLVATVPRSARTGRIVVRSRLARSVSTSWFRLLPSPAEPPEIRGEARVGNVLSATRGAWYGAEPSTDFTFSWLSCNRHGRDCRVIRGATRRSLKLTADRIGETVRILVVARTASGSGRARSAATSPVG